MLNISVHCALDTSISCSIHADTTALPLRRLTQGQIHVIMAHQDFHQLNFRLKHWRHAGGQAYCIDMLPLWLICWIFLL